MTAAVWWWCEHNFAVSCSAEKVRKQRERGQTGELSVNCVGVWQQGKRHCTFTEMWTVRRRKIAPHSCDSDRDKPSSRQTRRLYSGAGGVKPATSELPGPIRLYLPFCWFFCLIGEAKEWDIKSFPAIKKKKKTQRHKTTWRTASLSDLIAVFGNK